MRELLLVLALALAVGWLVMRLRRGRDEQAQSLQPQKKLADTSPFHAVSIKSDESACAAAKELSGRRFLSTAAPRLPLPKCDVPTCRCRFIHHADRRKGKDRRSPFAPGGFSTGTGSFPQERRERIERRKDEDEAFF